MRLKLQKFLYFWSAFLLAFIPLYPKFPLLNVPGTYVAIRLEDLFIFLTFILVLLFWLIEPPKSFIKQYFLKPIVLFLFIGLIGVLNLSFVYQINSPLLSCFHWLRRLEYLIPLLLFLVLEIKENSLKKLLIVVFSATFLVDIYGLGQKYFNWPVISTMNREFSKGKLLHLTWLARISSTFAGHYDLAIFLVLVLNLALGFYFYYLKNNLRLKSIFWIWWFFSFYTLVLTASRVSIAAFFLTFPLILIAQKKFRLLALILIPTLIISLQSNNLNQRFYSLLPAKVKSQLQELRIEAKRNQEKLFQIKLSLNSRRPINLKEVKIPTPTPKSSSHKLSAPAGKTAKVKKLKPRPAITTPAQIASPTSRLSQKIATVASHRPFPTPEPIARAALRSSEIRFQVEWPRALRAFLKNPLIGTGYSSLGLSTDNDYLRLLGETGLLGIVSFFLVWLSVFYLLIRKINSKNRILIVSALAGLVSLFLSAVFIDAFESSKIAYYLWAISGLFISFNQSQE